jgi:hypothetical protein
MKLLTIDIRKPLFGNFVYLRDIYIDRAIRQKTKIRVKIPNGEAIIEPAKWKNWAIKNNKVMKKVFKFPDNPMVLYGGWLKAIPPKTEAEKQKELDDHLLRAIS